MRISKKKYKKMGVLIKNQKHDIQVANSQVAEWRHAIGILEYRIKQQEARIKFLERR